LEGDLTGQDEKGIDPDKLGYLLGEHGELTGTAHSKDALENESPSGMCRRAKQGP
jgi:hypothetical protein